MIFWHLETPTFSCQTQGSEFWGWEDEKLWRSDQWRLPEKVPCLNHEILASQRNIDDHGWRLDYAHSTGHDDTYCMHHNANRYDIDCDLIRRPLWWMMMLPMVMSIVMIQTLMMVTTIWYIEHHYSHDGANDIDDNHDNFYHAVS